MLVWNVLQSMKISSDACNMSHMFINIYNIEGENEKKQTIN